MDCSPPGSSIHGIFQARVPEWVAISFSRGSSRPRDRTQVSHIVARRFYHLSHQEVLCALDLLFSSSVWTGGFCLSFVILLLISVVLASNIAILQIHSCILISQSGMRSSIYNWALLSCDKTMKRLIHSLNTRSLDPCPICMALFSFSHQPISTGEVITSGHSGLAFLLEQPILASDLI